MNGVLQDWESAMCDELRSYCIAQGLEYRSADDLLICDVTSEQKAWLMDFCARWDAMLDAERKATAQ